MRPYAKFRACKGKYTALGQHLYDCQTAGGDDGLW